MSKRANLINKNSSHQELPPLSLIVLIKNISLDCKGESGICFFAVLSAGKDKRTLLDIDSFDARSDDRSHSCRTPTNKAHICIIYMFLYRILISFLRLHALLSL